MRGFCTFVLCLTTVLLSCERHPSFPKPYGYFAHNLEAAAFSSYENDFIRLPLNERVTIKNSTKKSVELYYPKLKASLFLNYTPLEMPLEDLILGIDRKLSEHQKKASLIVAFPYENLDKKKSGVLYEIKGNAASAAQFYMSDGQRHFLSGALYFNVKPNYDSIYPSAQYILRDIREIMDQLEWKNIK